MSDFFRWLGRFLRRIDPIKFFKIGIAVVEVASAKTSAGRNRAIKKLIKAIADLF
ncbi:hypothetical protein WME91_43470 [Sorangium sp. So ce269]